MVQGYAADEHYKALNTMAKFLNPGAGKIPKFLIKNGTLATIPHIKKDVAVDPRFAEREDFKGLQPLVFCHGLGSDKNNYIGLCREWASYGYVVIAFNHNDTSC